MQQIIRKRRRERMDTIVKQISEIENAAVNIMAASVEEKKEMDARQQKEIQEYDAQVDARTELELKKLNEELALQMEENLKKLKEATMKEIMALDSEYSKKHSSLSDGILKRMIEG